MKHVVGGMYHHWSFSWAYIRKLTAILPYSQTQSDFGLVGRFSPTGKHDRLDLSAGTVSWRVLTVNFLFWCIFSMWSREKWKKLQCSCTRWSLQAVVATVHFLFHCDVGVSVCAYCTVLCSRAAHVQGVIRLVAYKTQRFPHSSQVSEVHFENVKQAGGSIFWNRPALEFESLLLILC